MYLYVCLLQVSSCFLMMWLCKVPSTLRTTWRSTFFNFVKSFAGRKKTDGTLWNCLCSFLKKIVEPMVLSVLDFSWLCPWVLKSEWMYHHLHSLSLAHNGSLDYVSFQCFSKMVLSFAQKSEMWNWSDYWCHVMHYAWYWVFTLYDPLK